MGPSHDLSERWDRMTRPDGLFHSIPRAAQLAPSRSPVQLRSVPFRCFASSPLAGPPPLFRLFLFKNCTKLMVHLHMHIYN
jgi:hypothetical protein